MHQRRTPLRSPWALFLLVACCACVRPTPVRVAAAVGEPRARPDFRHFYGVAWYGEPADSVRYARQMGHTYIAYQKRMEKVPEAAGLRFLLESPEYAAYPMKRTIDLDALPAEPDRALYEKLGCWKGRDPFPGNLATGWWFTEREFSVQLDFQQQAVIDLIVERIVEKIRTIEAARPGFRFGGVMWDVPDFTGDFRLRKDREGTLSDWTGSDSCLLHEGITHEHATYADGIAAYYKQLFVRLRALAPDARFIMEPYDLYRDWIAPVVKRGDARLLMPDLLCGEKSGTAFVDDERIFASGLVKRSDVCLSEPNDFGEAINRTYLAKAALHGAWFNWFGRFGGSGDMPKYRSVRDVPARLLLARVIPNWDNLAAVPLAQRRWEAGVYRSTNSFASADVMYARHPFTGRIFVVFHTAAGVVKLRQGERLRQAWRVDGTFVEDRPASGELAVDKDQVRATEKASLGVGYILATGS